MAERSYTPEYLEYLERRYVDLKQLFEAVISYYPPDAYEENHLFETIVCEFNYLADILGYEDEGAMLDRLLSRDEDFDDIDDDDDD
ncbi:MAG: hypothetical protein K8L97_34170 [Anaerolineae bacterium]|nr:hypothetical protein [Anaerolineae bacterium]